MEDWCWWIVVALWVCVPSEPAKKEVIFKLEPTFKELLDCVAIECPAMMLVMRRTIASCS